MCRELRETIINIEEARWQAFIHRDGANSRRMSTSRIAHVMQSSRYPFTAIVQRSLKSGQQEFGFAESEEVEAIEYNGYIYRAIATNRENLSDSEFIHWHNQRVEHSENRIKELKLCRRHFTM